MADLRHRNPAVWPLILQQVSPRRPIGVRGTAKAPATDMVASARSPIATAGTAAAPDIEAPSGAAAAPKPSATNVTHSTRFARQKKDSRRRGQLQHRPAKPFRQRRKKRESANGRGGSSVVPRKPPCRPDWQTHLAAAIHQLEAQPKTAPKADAEMAQQAYLRMLYLLAGRRDDALSPIPGAPPAAQDFWSKQLYGMATWLDTDHTPDGTRRAAETKRILGEAMVRLGETAPLVVHNLAFCTEVQSFGSITPFAKAEFAPDQEVLLYAEVENFTVEPTPRGFHTSLRSSYQIFDARGQRVADHEFPPRKNTARARGATSSSAITSACRSESTTASTRCSLRSRT